MIQQLRLLGYQNARPIIIIMLSRLLFACGASTQFDLQGKLCIGRVKTPVA